MNVGEEERKLMEDRFGCVVSDEMGSESCGMRSEVRDDGRMWMANFCDVSL